MAESRPPMAMDGLKDVNDDGWAGVFGTTTTATTWCHDGCGPCIDAGIALAQSGARVRTPPSIHTAERIAEARLMLSGPGIAWKRSQQPLLPTLRNMRAALPNVGQAITPPRLRRVCADPAISFVDIKGPDVSGTMQAAASEEKWRLDRVRTADNDGCQPIWTCRIPWRQRLSFFL